ncbi:MAG: T9SS type A sorting domain-containing protein [Saprospiraceae bacterium]|nr:T9SS type A sorting domain-containing protein [Candidatus Brachybacter algidus]
MTDLKDEEQGWLVKLDADGCIDKNCKTLLGDQEVIEIDELKVGVYPNPSNGLLKVNIPYGQNMDDCMIKIYDIVGNVILNKKLFEGVNDIDLGKDVTSGVLIYNVSSDSGKSLKSGKLIITK